MNHLAHLVLSKGHPHLSVGNFLADLVDFKTQKKLPKDIYKGILLHRFIDVYADNHPEVKAARAIIRPEQGKYTPVVMDIYFDYMLAQQWDSFVRQPFKLFEQDTYDLLDHYLPRQNITSDIQQRVVRMIQGNWLSTYTTLEGIERVFYRLRPHLKFQNNLALATVQLEQHYRNINAHFKVFWLQLEMSTHQKIEELNADKMA